MEVVVESIVVDVAKHGTRAEEGIAGLVEVNTQRVDKGRGLVVGGEDDRRLQIARSDSCLEGNNNGVGLWDLVS